jgi:adenine-specific DNA-methyltransferase
MPQLLLGRCEFGKEDYSFNIVNLPVDDDTENEEVEIEVEKTEALTKKKKSNQSSPELFD